MSTSLFEKEYEAWLAQHTKRRKGHRLRRLKEGHGYLEKMLVRAIWWPAFGSFQDTHPEYEVKDYRDGNRYLDLAFCRHGVKLALEADGYGPHVRDITQERHAELLLRDAFLIADGWTVIHISKFIMEHRPREMQQYIQQMVWRLPGRESPESALSLSLEEKEVIRLSRRAAGPVTPKEVASVLLKT